MISKAYILEWRHQAPWQLESQVEQDLILSRALVEIFAHQEIREEVAFRGGTALNKLFFKRNFRYSEDIDLVRIKTGPVKPLIVDLQNTLDPWLGKSSVNQKSDSISLIYRFLSEAEPVTKLRLKIEINTRESQPVQGFSIIPYEVKSRWFSADALIRSYETEEIMATKLRALYQRKKGRDLLDLDHSLYEFSNLDIDYVIQNCQKYFNHQNLKVTRAQFEKNLYEKMKDDFFLNDTQSLMASGTDFDPKKAYERVMDKFVSQFPGDSWKGNG